MKIKKIYTTIGVYLMLAMGSLVCALGLNLFLAPNQIAAGGVSGLAIVLHYLFAFPIGAVMLVINIPLFVLGLWRLGAKFCIRTIFATLLFSGFVDGLSFFHPFTTEPVLASIYGGLIMGLGFAVVMRFGATTGGTDLAAAIVCDFGRHLKIGQVLMLIDAAVILFAGLAFRDREVMLYAIVAIFVSSKVIDLVLSGANFGKTAYVISDHPREIAEEIMRKMGRGVTGMTATGMYTGNDKTVLLCVITQKQIHTLKTIVKRLDENAFIILTDAKEVLGEGFKV